MDNDELVDTMVYEMPEPEEGTGMPTKEVMKKFGAPLMIMAISAAVVFALILMWMIIGIM